jgi:hypothetical protein
VEQHKVIHLRLMIRFVNLINQFVLHPLQGIWEFLSMSNKCDQMYIKRHNTQREFKNRRAVAFTHKLHSVQTVEVTENQSL